jgi:hypothetical protein
VEDDLDIPRINKTRGLEMSEESVGNPPRSFLIVSIVALLWNLFGVMSYLGQVTMSPETLSAMPEAERALFDGMPAWATGLFAIAVFSGVLGCVGLLLKKTWSVPVFMASLAAVVVQFGYWLFFAGSIDVYGPAAIMMPLLVTAAAIFLVWYSQDAKIKGWLS